MFVRVLVFILSIYMAGSIYLNWSRESSYRYVIPKYGELQVSTGTLELHRPWKVAPYLLLRTNGRDLLLDCSGPYDRNYWCDDIERAGFDSGGRYTVRWHPWGKNGKNFVFEILNDGGVLVGYEKQCALYLNSLEKGLPDGQLVVAATALVLAVFSIVGIRKK